MLDISQYRSHPNKSLLDHTRGVLEGVQLRTNSKVAEIAAIFHDVGKINPHFQKKLDGENGKGYSNHSYLSAFSFLSFCANNQSGILDLFGNQKEWLASILAIIAHHHGNLPDFKNIILKEEETKRLITFLEQNTCLPASDFLQELLPHKPFSVLEQPNREHLCSSVPIQLIRTISNPIDFFLETQFSFSCLIATDKVDASGFSPNPDDISSFCHSYNNKLETYLSNFSIKSPLNKLRTKMRVEAVKNLNSELKNGTRLFSLTAPTGSGKTMMLLALADEILKHQPNMRIIYALPFLSITEQVAEISYDVFKGLTEHIRRIDSKADNSSFEEFQKELDANPDESNKILAEQFAEDTFDYPFMITTFVRLFETLVSNKNATLLKLPNFSNSIFLIDEIQALPPRLYGFFIALLDAFCRKVNSYAIISTATMPNFDLPENNKHDLKSFFNDYSCPPELLSLEHFENSLFNRYNLERIPEPIEIHELADLIANEAASGLVILNTIQDTKDLYDILSKRKSKAKIVLLNTHFTPNDRLNKIDTCKAILEKGHRVILISTQLIEAGVDIDFPIVYRDICPIPNLVQSAGRCNRNGKYKKKGRMIIFDLQKNNQSRSTLIYRGKDSRFLNYAKEKILDRVFEEPELLFLQKNFFVEIKNKTVFGLHESSQFENDEIDFIERIKQGAFKEIGKFKLIDDNEFGEQNRYFIPKSENDNDFDTLQKYYQELKTIATKDHTGRRLARLRLQNQLRRMAGQIIQIRLHKNGNKPLVSDECCGISKISNEYYDNETGIRLNVDNQIL